MGKAAAPQKTEQELSGLRKAAILLVSLDTDTAAKLLANMDRSVVEMVSKEIALLEDSITSEIREKVLEEFYNLIIARQYVEEGGMEYAKLLLEKSLPPDVAAQILEELQTTIQQTPFHFLQKADPEDILTFIQDEHPQTIAVILSHLNPDQASKVLAGLPSKKQVEVVKRIAKMDQTSPEAVKQVEEGLERRFASIVSQAREKTGGVEAVAEILNLTDRTTERGILESLEEEDPDLVEQIRKLMFVFEDLILVNDKGIQAVLKEVDNEELALALKTASDELKEKIFRNMSERAATLVKEDMEYMGPVRVADVEAAQQRIVDIVRRLEEAGEVIIQGRGGEEEVIV